MAELEIGDTLKVGHAKYVKLAQIGAGGYADVSSYWSLDPRSSQGKRLVAIKAPFYAGRLLARHETDLNQLVQQRADNAGVQVPTVPVLQADRKEASGEWLLVLEHAAGTLDELDGRLTAHEFSYLASELLTKLDVLHKTGQLIHCDVKPGNILLGFKSEVETKQHALYLTIEALKHRPLALAKRRRLAQIAETLRGEGIVPSEVSLDHVTARTLFLGDIGLSCPLTYAPTGLIGTLGYMAPEVMAAGNISKQIDLYSAGITLAEVLISEHLLQIVGRTSKKQILNILHQLAGMIGPFTQGFIISLKHRRTFFDGFALKESVSAPPVTPLQERLRERCQVLGWSAEDADRVIQVIAQSLKHQSYVRPAISNLVHKLQD